MSEVTDRFRSVVLSRLGHPYSCTVEERDRAAATKVLSRCTERSREALIRFYGHRERSESIQASLGLSETEFRDLREQARRRWAALRAGALGNGQHSGGCH